MKVSRLYDIERRFFNLLKLWSRQTVFSAPNYAGKQETLTRLKQHRDDIDEVIVELESELEDEAWLQ